MRDERPDFAPVRLPRRLTPCDVEIDVTVAAYDMPEPEVPRAPVMAEHVVSQGYLRMRRSR